MRLLLLYDPIGLRGLASVFVVLATLFVVPQMQAQPALDGFDLSRSYHVPEARQGVAVDSSSFYAISNSRIAKYNRDTGERIAAWQEVDGGPITHLDSGVIVDGMLICASSNYPKLPMTSSVEIWEASTLRHTDSHSFGIQWGSLTWIDRFDGFWWGVFVHYEGFREALGKGNEWSTLVKFSDSWDAIEAWSFPSDLLRQFYPMSNSGGSWGEDGNLYLTGHDSVSLYVVALPSRGSELEWVSTLSGVGHGQGIAWDRSGQAALWGIRRSENAVVVGRLRDR